MSGSAPAQALSPSHLERQKSIRYNGKNRRKKEGKEKRDRAPRYDEKFKEGVIRLITERRRPSKEVAAELGICLDTLRNGLKAAGAPSPGQAGRQNREAKKDKNRGLRVF